MPPKKKLKDTDDEQKLSFSLELISSVPVTSMSSSATADCTTDSRQPLEESECTISTITTTRRGNVVSWRAFADIKWRNKHPWLQLKVDGIYCLYCSHDTLKTRSKTQVFVTEPFTGNRPDHLLQHEGCAAHESCAIAYHEGIVRVATKQT